jgi:hypothetical protein
VFLDYSEPSDFRELSRNLLHCLKSLGKIGFVWADPSLVDRGADCADDGSPISAHMAWAKLPSNLTLLLMMPLS